MNEPKIGALRVWHIPRVPGKPFHVYVDTLQEAQRVAADLDYQQHRESGRAHRALQDQVQHNAHMGMWS